MKQFITELLKIAFISVILGVIFIFVLFEFAPLQVQFQNFASVGSGGCLVPLYDGNGEGHLPPFDIPSPLYGITIEDLQLPISSGCPEFPTHITPTLALQGRPLYPLIIDVSIPRNWIRSGESVKLETKISLQEHFGPNAWRPFHENTQEQLWFNLQTTTFNFEPANDEERSFVLSRDQPIEQVWIISPKDNALGTQYLQIVLRNSDQAIYETEILEFEVRHWPGINPWYVGIIVAIGSFLTGSLKLLTSMSQTKLPLLPRKHGKGDSEQNRRAKRRGR